MGAQEGFSPVIDAIGSGAWRIEPGTADDTAEHIKGFADTTSVARGETISFSVSVAVPQPVTVEIYRVGAYGAERAALFGVSKPIQATREPPAFTDPKTGMITCSWEPVWRLRVPPDWPACAYLAVLRTEDGHANYVPFAVRGGKRGRTADWLIVLPFSTYQAYNMYPLDGVRGKNLYHGFDASGAQDLKQRAQKVSFRRPYELTGMPREADRVHDFVVWADRQGYDMDFATSHDLHEGRVDPLRYKGLIFPGHDEYWSAKMRGTLQWALDAGVSAVFLQANNAYWHIRLDGPTLTCYKTRQDPDKSRPGETIRWRDLRLPEQVLLGAQYVSVVKGAAELVAKNTDHWFWTAAGVARGETFKGLVVGEADALQAQWAQPESAELTVLAESPYADGDGSPQTQQTVLRRTATGSWVFTAGTFTWPVALGRDGETDDRIQAATAALLARIAAGDGLASPGARRTAANVARLKRDAGPAAVLARVRPTVRKVKKKVKHTLKKARP